jgi:squalene-hopene/tetraprenyl-beta-curcumene cyclase
LLLLAACGAPEPPTLDEEIDAALTRGLDFLGAQQAADGTWVSGTYGNLKDTRALTAMLAKVMLFSSHGERANAALDALAADPSDVGLAYPVYSASLAAIALSQPGSERPAARDAWVALLRRHQLSEELGWSATDLAYGGWGYSLTPPSKDQGDGHTRFDADLSSTLFAVGALRLAGAPADDPAIVSARTFVERCQNFGTGEPDFDDGGFYFTPTNEGQNKAGVAGTDRAGRTRYHSYGALTADGLRALLRCGLAPDHERVVAARDWLSRHFDPASNPGVYDPAREIERDASYYYWCWSASHAFYTLQDGPPDWSRALARELLARQQPDGSWRNRFTMVKEDDPLIATSFATAALSLCRLTNLGVRHEP